MLTELAKRYANSTSALERGWSWPFVSDLAQPGVCVSCWEKATVRARKLSSETILRIWSLLLKLNRYLV